MAKSNTKNPGYSKNLKKSAKAIAKEITMTSMPALSETVVSAQTTYKELREFMTRNKSRVATQKRLQERTLLAPVTELIENAKEDIRSGKFYNEERIQESQSSSMSEFLEFGYDEESSASDEASTDMSSYRNFLATTSASSMASAKAISDTQTKTAEYLGELQKDQHIQNLMLNNKYHLETMGKLGNIEKLATSMIEFNVNTMQEHIQRTQTFYQSVLSEMSEMNSSISKLTNRIENRFGEGKKGRYKSTDLENIYGGGSFDIMGYKDMIKKNLAMQIPFTKEMMKMTFDDFKASPISSIIKMASSGALQKSGIGKTAGKFDKTIQGAFAKYLNVMGDWKSGKTGRTDFLGDIMQAIGKIAAPDTGSATGKPDLSQYKNQTLSLELEQKKAKAITEVIPQYLSEITKKLTGKDMYFDYDKGTFSDRKEARAKMDKDRNRLLASGMSDSREYFNERLSMYANASGMDKVSKEVLEEDIDAFLAWISTDGYDWKPNRKSGIEEYKKVLNKGLHLRGGFHSYKIISNMFLSTPGGVKRLINSERTTANAMSVSTMNRFSDSLTSSGASALYNGFDKYDKKVERLKFKEGFSTKDSLFLADKMRQATDDERRQYRIDFENRLRRESGKEPIDHSKDGKTKNTIMSWISKIPGLDKYSGVAKDIKKQVDEAIGSITSKVDGFMDDLDDRMYNDYNAMAGEAYNPDIDYFFDQESPTGKTATKVKVSGKKKKKSGSDKIKARIVKTINSPSPFTSGFTNAATSEIINSMMEFRPYFETLDAHLNHSPKLVYSDKYEAMAFERDIPLLVKLVDGGGIPGVLSAGDAAAINPYNEDGSINTDAIIDSFRKGASTARTGGRKLWAGIKNVGLGIFNGTVNGAQTGLKKANEVKDKVLESELGTKAKNFVSDGVEKAGEMKDSTVEYFKSDKFKDQKEHVKEVTGEAKDRGFKLLTAIGSGIMNAGGNVVEYFKSDSFKQLLGNMKAGLAKGGKGLLDTGKMLFDKFKDVITNFGGAAWQKGKGIAIGGMVSSMLGMGPIPGAVIGALFGKKDKKAEMEGKQAAEAVEGEENGGKKGLGFFTKGKNLAIGGIASTLLTGSPLPGLLIASIINKKKKKAEAVQAEKEGEDAANAVEGEENKKKKGIGFFKKGKNLAVGAIASSLLGLGPIPGMLVAGMINKRKDKAAQKEAEHEGKETAKAVEEGQEQTTGKKKGKGGFFNKIKRFFGKSKNLVLGATASTLLGLGPLPGIIVASMINKRKYRKDELEPDKDEKKTTSTPSIAPVDIGIEGDEGGEDKSQTSTEKVKSSVNETANAVLASTGTGMKLDSSKNKEEKTATRDEEKKQKEIEDKKKADDSLAKKNAKQIISDAQDSVKAERAGNIEKANRIEDKIMRKAKNSGDTSMIETSSAITANYRDQEVVQGIKEEAKNPEKGKGLFSMLGGLFGNLLGNGSALGGIAAALLGYFGIKTIKDLFKKMKGETGHGYDDEAGNAQFANGWDHAIAGVDTAENAISGKIAGMIGTKALGVKGLGMATYGATQSMDAARYYGQEEDAYYDRGATTLGQEQTGLKVKSYGKAAAYTYKGAKLVKKAAGKIITKVGDKALTGMSSNNKIVAKLSTWIADLLTDKKILKLFKKAKASKVVTNLTKALKKIMPEAVQKIAKKSPGLLTKIAGKVGAIASVVLTWLPVVTAVAAFISGWNNAARDLKLDPESKVFSRLRLANGLLYALDDVLCGALDIVGLRDWLLEIITNCICDEKQMEEIKNSQDSQMKKYEQFLKDNDLNSEGFTFDMYNKMTNKSIWGHVKGWFGADDLSKYKKGGKKNKELQSKYGGYVENKMYVDNSDNSDTVNIVTSDNSGGSGGRGPSLANKSSVEVLRDVRDKITNSLGKKTNTISNEQIENYTKQVQSSNKEPVQKKSNNFLSNIGSTIKGAASWIVNGIVSGFNWLKNKFTGSGGRGGLISGPYTESDRIRHDKIMYEQMKKIEENSVESITGRGGGVDTTNYYSQNDSRWANKPFGRYDGKRDTIKAGGCGPTVAAMALQELSGKTVLPSTMADLALKAGQKYDDGGTDPDFFSTAANSIGLNAYSENGLSKNSIKNLRNGIPVPLMGKGGVFGNGMHYLLANNLDSSGNVEILDPQNKNNNKIYNIKDINKDTSVSTIFTPKAMSYVIGRGKSNRFVKNIKNVFGRATIHSPIKYGTIQPDGYGDSQGHKGVDVHVARGCPVYAIADASVVYAEYGHVKQKTSKDTAFSVKIKLDSPISFGSKKVTYVYYTHLQENLAVSNGQKIKQGDVLGYTGIANNCEHLHISIMFDSSNEGGHTNTMNFFGWSHNQSLQTIGLAENKPTTATGLSTVDRTGSVNSGVSGDISSNENNSSGTILSQFINGINIKNPVNNNFNSLLVGNTSDGTTALDSGSSSVVSSVTGTKSEVLGKNLTDMEAYNHKAKYYSTITADQLKQAIRTYTGRETWMERQVPNIMKAAQTYGIDPRWLVANAAGEEGWDGTSDHCKTHHNFMGYGVYGGKVRYSWNNDEDGWLGVTKLINDEYFAKGQDSFYLMNNPTAAGQSSNHAYTPGYVGPGAKGKVYGALIRASGGAGRGIKNINIPKIDMLQYGRGIDLYKNSPIDIKTKTTIERSKISLDPSKSVETITSGISRQYPQKTVTDSTKEIIKEKVVNNFDERMYSLFTQMIELLGDIKSSSQTIADKEFSPIVQVSSNGGNGGYPTPQQQKSNIYDHIISGL